MQNIKFTITDEEIKKESPVKMNNKQISEVLEIVECDEILWNDINKSMKEAISFVLSKKA